jgi:hypothetical protein
MGEAGLPRDFVPGAHPIPDLEGDQGRLVVLQQDDLEPVRKNGLKDVVRQTRNGRRRKEKKEKEKERNGIKATSVIPDLIRNPFFRISRGFEGSRGQGFKRKELFDTPERLLIIPETA